MCINITWIRVLLVYILSFLCRLLDAGNWGWWSALSGPEVMCSYPQHPFCIYVRSRSIVIMESKTHCACAVWWISATWRRCWYRPGRSRSRSRYLSSCKVPWIRITCSSGMMSLGTRVGYFTRRSPSIPRWFHSSSHWRSWCSPIPDPYRSWGSISNFRWDRTERRETAQNCTTREMVACATRRHAGNHTNVNQPRTPQPPC